MPKVNLFSYRFRDEGAAIAAFDIYTCIKRFGCSINAVIFSPKDYRFADIRACHTSVALFFIYLDLVLNRIAVKAKSEYFTCLNPTLPLWLLRKPSLHCDIIHIHWHHRGFLGPRQLLRLAEKYILIFTIHDFWFLTGGCHFPSKCEQFTNHCIRCPSIKKNIYHPIFISLDYKRRIIEHSNTYFVFPSEYARQLAIGSIPSIANKSSVIPNPVRFTEVYSRPRTKSFNLHVPTTPVIGLQITNNPRKGDQDALIALSAISKSLSIRVLLFGESYTGDTTYINSLDYHHVGFIRDRQMLFEFYNSIDIYLSAAMDETFGLTVAEAQACATPVVAFNSAAIAEIIDHKLSGYLAEPGNLEDLQAGIYYCTNSLSILSAQAFRCAQNRFNPQKIAQQYLELYENLL